MDAEKIFLLPIPMSGPLAMNAGLPVPKGRTMALAAEKIGLRKLHELSAREMQLVPVVGTVTVQAPAVSGIVFKFDFGMLVRQLAPFRVDLCPVVTLSAGKNPLLERGRWSLNISGSQRLFPLGWSGGRLSEPGWWRRVRDANR